MSVRGLHEVKLYHPVSGAVSIHQRLGGIRVGEALPVRPGNLTPGMDNASILAQDVLYRRKPLLCGSRHGPIFFHHLPRADCGLSAGELTLKELSEAVDVSKSALGTYETGDFKDISPFSVVKLATFYGVSTDYLLGVSNIEKETDAEIHELHLTNDALNVLKGVRFNGMLLSEVMSHRNFQRLMTDMEIFVDGIASMQIDSLNNFMGTVRETVQAQYHPDENELFYRTLELAKISGDEYIGSVLRDDLTGILNDIRESHPENRKDKSSMSVFAAMEDFQKNVF